MKRNVNVLTIIFSIILSSNLVAAQNLPAPPIAANTVFEFFNALLSNQGYAGFSGDIIARMLIFLLLVSVVYLPATRIFGSDKKNLAFVIALIVSLMGIRFMSPQMIRGLFLPYEAFGVLLSIIIPFILFELLMIGLGEEFPKPFRTIGYFMLSGVFLGMWWLRWTDIGDLSWYYLIAAVVSLIALSFDGTLRNWYAMSQLESARSRQLYLQVIDLEQELSTAAERLATAIRTGDQKLIRAAEKEMKEVKSAIEAILKHR